MKQIAISLLGAILLLTGGCQRNTDELPTTDVFFNQNCYAGNNDVLLTGYFDEHVSQQPYYLSAHFQAQAPKSFTNARILVQAYSGTPGYSSLKFSVPVTYSNLTSTTLLPDNTIANNITFPFDNSQVYLYLLGYQNAPFSFSGYYPNGTAIENFTGYKSDTVPVQGVVDATGNTILYIQDAALSTVTGIFSSGSLFVNGSIVPAGNTAQFNLASSIHPVYSRLSTNLGFTLQVSQPDTISGHILSSVTFNLSGRE